MQVLAGGRSTMAASREEGARRTKRLAYMRSALEQRFTNVEQVGITRFLVWGSEEFRFRPYIEIWFDQGFLDQEKNVFQAHGQKIVSEAEVMLNNPDQGVRKQGEILASGKNGIKVRRGIHMYHLTGMHENGSDS